MTPLNATFSFTKLNHIGAIAKDLDFDMSTIWIIFLKEHSSVLEQRFSSAFDFLESRGDFFLSLADLQSHSATSSSCFQHDLASISIIFFLKETGI